MQKEIVILGQRKMQNEGCDVLVLTNEILWKSYNHKSIFEKKDCAKCCRNRYHLIKLLCCKNFICIACMLGIQKRKCIICQTESDNHYFWFVARKIKFCSEIYFEASIDIEFKKI